MIYLLLRFQINIAWRSSNEFGVDFFCGSLRFGETIACSETRAASSLTWAVYAPLLFNRIPLLFFIDLKAQLGQACTWSMMDTLFVNSDHCAWKDRFSCPLLFLSTHVWHLQNRGSYASYTICFIVRYLGKLDKTMRWLGVFTLTQRIIPNTKVTIVATLLSYWQNFIQHRDVTQALWIIRQS